MKLKVLVQIFSFLLAFNFAGEVILTSEFTDVVQVEIDLDSDSEKKESKNEKESDKIRHNQMLSKFETQREGNLLEIHRGNRWTCPTIELNSPPPELG